jgi:broad specificity phosphatase PhoE
LPDHSGATVPDFHRLPNPSQFVTIKSNPENVNACAALMTARLTLISHGTTRATLGARFPDDDPLEAAADRAVARIAASCPPISRVLTSPALAARQTAAYFPSDFEIDAALDDCDYGRWRGHALTQIQEEEPDNLAAWLTDPNAIPHGGESLTALIRRVSGWLDLRLGDHGRMIAITHSAVIRAAIVAVLAAPPSAFWRIDIEPLGLIELTSDGIRWRLRATMRRATEESIMR